jgi:ribosomal protein L10
MKAEKKCFVKEVYDHLGKSDSVYSADFSRETVATISALHKKLRGNSAECRIVSNRILKFALAEKSCEDVGDECLEGHTAILVADAGPSGVAKTLFKFSKDNEERMGVQSGALSKHSLPARKIRAISELRLLEMLRAQIFALFNTPAQQLLRACSAVPQDVVNVS